MIRLEPAQREVCRAPHSEPQRHFLAEFLERFRRKITQYRAAGANGVPRCPKLFWELLVHMSANTSALRLEVTHNPYAMKDRLRADGVVATLLRAIEASGLQIQKALIAMRPPVVVLPFTFSDNVPYDSRALMPVLSMAMSENGTGLAVPEWTFAHWSEINAAELRVQDSSWRHTSQALVELAAEYGEPSQRRATILWRGSRSNQPAWSKTMPFEQRFRRYVALDAVERLERDGSLSQLSLSADATCRTQECLQRSRARNHSEYMSWPEMCRSRYMLHLAGFGFSYALRYRMACGSLVLRPKALEPVGRWLEPVGREWWEAVSPLRPGVEYVELDGNLSQLLPELKRLEADRGLARSMQEKAMAYVRDSISDDAVLCYWRQLLEQYAGLFAQYRATCAGSNEDERNVTAQVGLQEVGYVSNPKREWLPSCFPLGANPCFRSRKSGDQGAFNVTVRQVPNVYELRVL